MNVSSEATAHKPKSRSTTTTLYDLIADINASMYGAESGNFICDIHETAGNNRNSQVAEKVAQMFESGQIRFMNDQDIRRKYADWLI
jgi:hypothetical protein